MPRILIGRLTSAEATWDIEPEEVNGFELDPLPHSTRSKNHARSRVLDTHPLRGGSVSGARYSSTSIAFANSTI